MVYKTNKLRRLTYLGEIDVIATGRVLSKLLSLIIIVRFVFCLFRSTDMTLVGLFSWRLEGK